jgi:hypothetical protein
VKAGVLSQSAARNSLTEGRKHRNFPGRRGLDGQACPLPSPQSALDDGDAYSAFLELAGHPRAGRFANTGAVHENRLRGRKLFACLVEGMGIEPFGSADANRLAIQIAVAANVVDVRPCRASAHGGCVSPANRCRTGIAPARKSASKPGSRCGNCSGRSAYARTTQRKPMCDVLVSTG